MGKRKENIVKEIILDKDISAKAVSEGFRKAHFCFISDVLLEKDLDDKEYDYVMKKFIELSKCG